MAKPIRIAAAAPRKPRTAAARKPTYDQIQARAYEVFLRRGGTPGDELQDWLQAERELLASPRKTAAKAPKAVKAAKAPKPSRPVKEQAA